MPFIFIMTTVVVSVSAYMRARLNRTAREEKGEDDLYGALDDAKAALEADGGNTSKPSSREAMDTIRRLEPVVKERQEKQKEEMLGKLKDLGNMFLGNFGLSCDNFKMEQDPNTGGYSVKFEK